MQQGILYQSVSYGTTHQFLSTCGTDDYNFRNVPLNKAFDL